MYPSDVICRSVSDDRKGSLTLRSNHMNYSRAILNTGWHQSRESEPKDYDLNKHPVRTMVMSTYNRIGNVTDGTFPETTYQEQANQVFLKPVNQSKDSHRGMVQPETVASANAGIDRDTGNPKDSFGSVLPFHGPDHNKFYLDTTYKVDYVPQYPFKLQDKKQVYEKSKGMEAKFPVYRKMKSQFTDTADYRRNGWNTWQDESGIYANSHFKGQEFSKSLMAPERLA